MSYQCSLALCWTVSSVQEVTWANFLQRQFLKNFQYNIKKSKTSAPAVFANSSIVMFGALPVKTTICMSHYNLGNALDDQNINRSTQD